MNKSKNRAAISTPIGNTTVDLGDQPARPTHDVLQALLGITSAILPVIQSQTNRLHRLEEKIDALTESVASKSAITNTLCNNSSGHALDHSNQDMCAAPSEIAEQLVDTGEKLYGEGDYVAAQELFSAAIAIQPNHIDALNNLGVLLFEHGESEASLEYFIRVLDLDPSHKNAVINCAIAQIQAGRVDEALKLCTGYLQQHPSDLDAKNIVSQLDMAAMQNNRDADTDNTTISARRVYLHLENICGRARLEIEKVKNYLLTNGHMITQDRSDAHCVLLFGCAFNTYTEKQSKLRLDEFLATKQSEQVVFIIEGLADTMGKELISSRLVDPACVIRTGQYHRLDDHFLRVTPYMEIPEANFIGQYDGQTCTSVSLVAMPTAKAAKFDRYNVQVGHGCNDNCAFCGDKVVVKNIKSKPLAACIAEVRRGIELGYEHIQLVGDDVGAYGLDIGINLIKLLDQIVDIEGNFFITMMELNTKYVARFLIDFKRLFATGKFKSMVVAFQSGNDRILKMMRRGYTRDQLLSVVKMIDEHHVFKHAHAMIGFPTETWNEFEETLDVIITGQFESASFFIYQDRKSASASKLEPKVSESEKYRRLDYTREFFEQRGYRTTLREDKLQIQRA